MVEKKNGANQTGAGNNSRQRNKIMKTGRPRRFFGLDLRVVKIWRNIELRCTDTRVNKYEYYGGRGIHNLLTPYDVQFLWDRDNAAVMAHPSIDRKKSERDYTLENCRFVEFETNRKNSWRNKKRIRGAAIALAKRQIREARGESNGKGNNHDRSE